VSQLESITKGLAGINGRPPRVSKKQCIFHLWPYVWSHRRPATALRALHSRQTASLKISQCCATAIPEWAGHVGPVLETIIASYRRREREEEPNPEHLAD